MSSGKQCATLRQFDRAEIADQLINEYITLHRDEILKSTAELTFPLGDARLTQRLDEIISAIPDIRVFGDIIKKITSANSYHPDDVTFLANAPAEDYYNFFRTERSPELRSYVKRCLEFGSNATSEKERLIARKATDALRELASENRINRVRVEALYGISLHDGNSTEETSPSASSGSEKEASGEAKAGEETQ